MIDRSNSFPPSRVLLALAALALSLIAGLTVTNLADGARKAKVLGAVQSKEKPECCNAMGKVTGFQTAVGGEKKVFKAPSNGHIVAWSVALGNPDQQFLDFAAEKLASPRYGAGPVGRIAVLNAKGKGKFKLVKQTPAVELDGNLGTRPLFTLRKPIQVKKGRVLALTVPTWATNYTARVGGSSQWLASRSSKRCNLNQTTNEGRENLTKSRAHSKVGSIRKYGCRYGGERILYWVYFVPKKKAKKG